MAFYGCDFLFDGQFSQNYGLKIMSINGSNVTNSSSGSNTEIFSESVYKNPTKFNYGASQSEVLSFEMEITSELPIMAINRSKIQKWLFGKINPCKLQIVQPDMQTIYFNCYLLNPKATYICDVCHGYTFTVECDAPWAWQLPKTYKFESFDSNINFYNDSDNCDYTYPLIKITANSSIIGSGDVTIINKSDNNRITTFTDIHPNEVITINNQAQSITSSEGRLLSESFNKKFFRLLCGQNVLDISGELSKIEITYSNARKVGG